MKIFLLIPILFFFSFSSYSQNYWEEVYSGTGINSVSFFSGGVISHTNNSIISSSDLGATWDTILTTDYIISAYAAANNVFYYSGDFNSLFRSLDYGQTWDSSFNYAAMSMEGNSSGDIFMETGLLIGGESYRTTDSGSTWNKIGIPYKFLIKIDFNNSGEVFAIYDGYLYRSSNNGISWELLLGSSLIRSLKVTAGYIIVGTFSGTFFKSTDNGNNWAEIGGGIFSGKEIYDIKENSVGYLFAAVDSFGVYRSIDEGSNWHPFNSGLTTGKIFNLAMDQDDFLFGISAAEGGTQKIFRTKFSTIPVELISFTADVSSNNVELNWITASETNNHGFEIQKKNDDNDFTSIAFIKGTGTTTEKQYYSFTDKNLSPGKYSYMLKQIDYDGSFEYSKEIEVEIGIPNEFLLYQNYPNPFNPSTKIKYSIPYSSKVTLKVFDVLGKEVASLVNEEKAAGEYEVDFNASNLSSGVYFYQLKAGSYSQIKKMLLVK